MARRMEQAAREALLARQRELRGLGRAQVAMEDALTESPAGDLVDRAAVVESVAGLESLRRMEHLELSSIASALAKLETGTYGLCETCSRPIAPRRLEAVPWTRLCQRCVASAERARGPRA